MKIDPLAIRPSLCERFTETVPVPEMNMLTADGWVAEQKLDGIRVLARVVGPRVTFLGRNGRPVNHAGALKLLPAVKQALLDAFRPIGTKAVVVLDGELLVDDGCFIVFDLPWFGPTSHQPRVTPADTLTERRIWLEQVFATTKPDPAVVRPVYQARTTDEKMALRDLIAEADAEGIVYKRSESRYLSGRRSPDWLKLKLFREADLVVTGTALDGKENVTLGVNVDGVLVEVGRCSTLGKDKPEVGDVVEVKYLYLGAGGRLYQPELLRIRTDKDPDECTIDQLVSVNKSLVDACDFDGDI